jgi:hypothetical protein
MIDDVVKERLLGAKAASSRARLAFVSSTIASLFG